MAANGPLWQADGMSSLHDGIQRVVMTDLSVAWVGGRTRSDWPPAHCTLEAFQQECCTDHVLIPSLQVNVQKDQLDTGFLHSVTADLPHVVLWVKPGVGATIVFALFNSSSRQQIFLTLNSTMVSGSILHCNRPSFSSPFQPLVSAIRVSSLLAPPHPLSQFSLAGLPLPWHSQPLQPKLSVSNTDIWQIDSHSWKEATLNLQRGRFKLQAQQKLKLLFETVSFWERWILINNHPTWRLPLSTLSNPWHKIEPLGPRTRGNLGLPLSGMYRQEHADSGAIPKHPY